jgi:hypothetical protein
VTDGRKWKSLSKKRYACAIGSDREKREDRGMRIVSVLLMMMLWKLVLAARGYFILCSSSFFQHHQHHNIR